MISRNPLAVIRTSLAVALSLLLPGYAADSGAGVSAPSTATITGRVQNLVSGQYLNNARVTIRDTDIVVFTDASGTYILPRVPSGNVTLDVFFTGLDPQSATIAVGPGQRGAHDFNLTSAARYGSGDVVKLDSFVISTSREMEGQARAINEQRFAANVKNVVSSDTHGDVTEGNIAEFMKFMPGVTVNYGDANITGISVRGLADNLTGVTMDGAPMAQSTHNGNSRTFEFRQLDINSISRLEVTKVPTPATPADSVAGSINLIAKSAFDRSKPELRYRAYFSVNGEDFTLRKTPFPSEKRTYKALPGFNLSYSKPFSDRFGILLTAASNFQYNVQDYAWTNWNAAGTSTGATPANPFLQYSRVIDAPKYVSRQSASIKADWRVSSYSVLSFDTKVGYYVDDNGNYSRIADVGANGTPTPANGIPMTFGPDFVNGATGRGTVTTSSGLAHIKGSLLAETLRYRFDDGNWRVDAGLSHSDSKSYSKGIEHGHFNSLDIALKDPARVVLSDIRGNRAWGIKAFNNNNQEIDLYDPNNFRINGANFGTLRNVQDNMKTADANLRRAFTLFSVPAAIQMGGTYRIQTRDRRSPSGNVLTYNPPGGDVSAAPYAAQVYTTEAPFGYGPIPWFSPTRAFEAWEKNPSLFSPTAAQILSNATSRITTSEWVQESVSALYLQNEVRLFRNRFHVLGGVRYERTTDDGKGPLIDAAAVWVRNANGTFARNASGARIRKPEAGAVGSLEQLSLTHIDRGYRAQRSYDGYYPSLHFTYNAMENLLVRLAYAKTYGRPNFAEFIPNTTVSEADVDLNANPNANPGSITFRNTGLRPWVADNVDLSLEYYTNQGGLFSANVFRKDIKDFFGDIVRVATADDIAELGLDPHYIGWTIRTSINAGTARISGVEFNIRHSLASVGGWGKYFQAFVNGTKLKLEAEDRTNWSGYVPESASWGITFTRNPITLMAQWNYRGRSRAGAAAGLGPDAYTYTKERTLLDVNADYQFGKNLSFFVNARNVFNVAYRSLVYGSETPDYAMQQNERIYGVQYAIGVKGTF